MGLDIWRKNHIQGWLDGWRTINLRIWRGCEDVKHDERVSTYDCKLSKRYIWFYERPEHPSYCSKVTVAKDKKAVWVQMVIPLFQRTEGGVFWFRDIALACMMISQPRSIPREGVVAFGVKRRISRGGVSIMSTDAPCIPHHHRHLYPLTYHTSLVIESQWQWTWPRQWQTWRSTSSL